MTPHQRWRRDLPRRAYRELPTRHEHETVAIWLVSTILWLAVLWAAIWGDERQQARLADGLEFDVQEIEEAE